MNSHGSLIKKHVSSFGWRTSVHLNASELTVLNRIVQFLEMRRLRTVPQGKANSALFEIIEIMPPSENVKEL